MKKILIVDDQFPFTSVLSECFTDLGYICETRDCGWDAVDLLKEKRDYFDLIISDFSMPMGNGKYILESMKSENIKTPIVFLTGDSCTEFNVEMIMLGALRCFPKPFGLFKFIKEIQNILIELEQDKESLKAA